MKYKLPKDKGDDHFFKIIFFIASVVLGVTVYIVGSVLMYTNLIPR